MEEDAVAAAAVAEVPQPECKYLDLKEIRKSLTELFLPKFLKKLFKN